MALSVRPGNDLAISAQRLPFSACAIISWRSSSALHSSRLMSGSRWLYHRSRHCFPIRPGSSLAIFDQRFGPSSVTSWTIFASSSAVHGPLTRSGFSTFCHLCKHCTSVRVSLKYVAAHIERVADRRQSRSTPRGASRAAPRIRRAEPNSPARAPIFFQFFPLYAATARRKSSSYNASQTITVSPRPTPAPPIPPTRTFPTDRIRRQIQIQKNVPPRASIHPWRSVASDHRFSCARTTPHPSEISHPRLHRARARTHHRTRAARRSRRSPSPRRASARARRSRARRFAVSRTRRTRVW